jgi:hypothetical protein
LDEGPGNIRLENVKGGKNRIVLRALWASKPAALFMHQGTR